MSNNPYAENVYKKKTVDNFKKTHQFSQVSQGKINLYGQSDAELEAIALALQPSTDLVDAKYIKWFVAKHNAMSATKQQNLVEDAMPANVKKLETAVLGAYDEGTPGYTKYFSRPKSGLYEGVSQKDKLVNLKTESALLVGDVSLAAAKIKFDLYTKSFGDTLKVSEDAQTALTKASTKLEGSRITWCDEVLGATGKLLTKFKLTPEVIEDIFDLSPFNPHHSNVDPDDGTLLVEIPTMSTVCINMMFDPLKSYYLHNSGICILKVGSASAADQQVLTSFITLQIDETKIASGAQLGDLINRYLLVTDENLVQAGELRIKEVV